MTLRTGVRLLAAVAFFLVISALIVGRNVNREVSRDEHLFVAGGALVSEGLLPYRDFPYLHMPYQALLFGALFRVLSYKLLTARLATTLCAVAALLLVFWLARTLSRGQRSPGPVLLPAASVLLIVANPFFIVASGRAWNHDLPVLLTLGAFVSHYRGLMWQWRWGVLLSGVLLGAAVGSRIVFALAVIPFAAVIVLHERRSGGAVGRSLAVFAAGMTLSLLPVGVLAALNVEKFMFDNIGYFLLNAEWRRVTGYPEAMTLPAKVRYLLVDLRAGPGAAALVLASVVCAGLRPAPFSARMPRDLGLLFAWLVAGVLFAGALVNTPVFSQYFYAPVPFLVLACAFAVASLDQGTRQRVGLSFLVLVVLISGRDALPRYRRVANPVAPSTWAALQSHALGRLIAERVGGGRVLTLAPIAPVEGGAGIYAEFAPGPFAWRSAGLLPRERRRALGLIAAPDLSDYLADRPPDGILVGYEGDLEDPLADYAMAHGYRAVRLPGGKTLWVHP